jgi:hypothetical protein
MDQTPFEYPDPIPKPPKFHWHMLVKTHDGKTYLSRLIRSQCEDYEECDNTKEPWSDEDDYIYGKGPTIPQSINRKIEQSTKEWDTIYGQYESFMDTIVPKNKLLLREALDRIEKIIELLNSQKYEKVSAYPYW